MGFQPVLELPPFGGGHIKLYSAYRMNKYRMSLSVLRLPPLGETDIFNLWSAYRVNHMSTNSPGTTIVW